MHKNSLCLIGAMVVGLAAVPASAQVTAEAGGSVSFEDNLLRQSRDVPIAPNLPRSDRIYSLDGTVRAQFKPGDIDGLLEVRAGQDWYERNSRLNNFNYQARLTASRASLDGIGLAVNGLSARRLSSFSDLRQPIRNLQFLNQADIEVTVPITPEIRLVVDPSYTENTNTADVLKLNDFRQYGVRGGLGWFTPLGNSIALTVTKRQTDGLRDRPVLTPVGVRNATTDLSDTSIDLKLVYAISPLTSVSAFVSYVDRDDKSVLDADYHGPAGSVTLDYHPRDTLGFTLTGGRRLEAQSLLFVDAVRTDFITLTTTARVYDRINLRLLADHYRRRFRYDPLLTNGLSTIEDRNYRLDAQLEYQIADRVRTTIGAAHEWRNSNFAFSNFSATSIQVGAIVGIGNKR